MCHIRTIGLPEASHRHGPSADGCRAGSARCRCWMHEWEQRAGSGIPALPVRGLSHAGSCRPSLHRGDRLRRLHPGVWPAVRRRLRVSARPCRPVRSGSGIAALQVFIQRAQRQHSREPRFTPRWRHWFLETWYADLRDQRLAASVPASSTISSGVSRLPGSAAERQVGSPSSLRAAPLVLDDGQAEADAVGDHFLLGG